MPRRSLRVLHIPTVVGGHPIGLACAERELGLDSRVISFEPTPPGFAADEVLFPRGRRLVRELRRWRFLRRAIGEADILHFNFGSGILPRYWPSAHGGARSLYGLYARLVEGRELAMLRRAGKGIVVTYQGDDARQAKSVHARVDADWIDDYYDSRDDARKRKSIAQFDRYAHAIFFLNPDLLDVLPARAQFLPYAATNPRTLVPVSAPHNNPPIVAHLPSDRRLKGTDAIISATNALGVRLRLVERVPHPDAVAAIAAADIVVDQLVIGWYGAVAVEAMALARPVVAHLHEPDLTRIAPEMRAELPVIDATASTLEDVLRTALSGDLEARGLRGRAFVERWHDPREIAQRVIDTYEQALPDRHAD